MALKKKKKGNYLFGLEARVRKAPVMRAEKRKMAVLSRFEGEGGGGFTWSGKMKPRKNNLGKKGGLKYRMLGKENLHEKRV